MSTRESKAYERLREKICRPTDRFERIENGLVDGMPDVNYCMAGCEGWIEIKCPEIPVKSSTALFSGNHPLSVAQANWFLAQHRARGRGALFIVTSIELLLLHGGTVGREGVKINAMTLAELHDIALWHAIPRGGQVAQESWFELRDALTR